MAAPVKAPELVRPSIDEPFLAPIDKPRSLILRLIYRMSRKHFGKVMMPLRVFMARMPIPFWQVLRKNRPAR